MRTCDFALITLPWIVVFKGIHSSVQQAWWSRGHVHKQKLGTGYQAGLYSAREGQSIVDISNPYTFERCVRSILLRTLSLRYRILVGLAEGEEYRAVECGNSNCFVCPKNESHEQ